MFFICFCVGKLEDFFVEFEEEPIASGAVAQVHKAVLKEMPEVFKDGICNYFYTHDIIYINLHSTYIK